MRRLYVHEDFLGRLNFSSKNVGRNAYTSGNHVIRSELAERHQINSRNPSKRMEIV